MINEKEIYKQQITEFNSIVLKINNLSKTVNNLILSGYPRDIFIYLTLENNILINSDDRTKDANEIIKKYEDLFKEYEKEIAKTYKKKPLFLSVIESIKKNKEIIFLLKAASKGENRRCSEFWHFKISDISIFSEIFSIINNYLEECFTMNKLNLQRIFEKNKLINKKESLFRDFNI